MAPQPFFSFHHANAFETADGKVVLDTVANLDGVDFSANFEVRFAGGSRRLACAGSGHPVWPGLRWPIGHLPADLPASP